MTREWDAAFAAIDVATAADRRAHAGTEVRIAMLKQALVLEQQGRDDEAKVVLDRVEELQREEGIVIDETQAPDDENGDDEGEDESA